ncbi:anti-sigma factor family protein [Paenibacillus pasadenensis]|uniref:anti-sigma factor family protein n=1 Tax=Paenibacillus pasadenensis TaxID=217090 RepID=UPI00042A8BC9|nr:anti-sigma factor [Paenibacillus pasadenensis]
MTCQEVVEYMNRYLDGDLDELERQELMEHLRRCPDDQELFERLQRLSGELGELPKVTPPFSLVDSILPQLDEIDAHREAKAFALQAAETAETGASGGQPARRPAAGRFSRRARIWTGSAAAAAAAAIILILAPWGSGPDSPLGHSNTVADTGGEAASMMSASEESAPASADRTEGAASGGSEAGAEPKQQIVDGQTVPTSTTPPDSETRSVAPRMEQNQRTQGPESPSVSAGGGQGSTVYPSPGGGAAREFAKTPQGIMNFAGPSPGVVSDIMGSADMGFAAVPEVTYSPDRAYSYSISQGWIVIQNAAGGKVFDHTFEGVVSHPVWSDDSRYLSVTVTATDGTAKPYRIDAENGALVE